VGGKWRADDGRLIHKGELPGAEESQRESDGQAAAHAGGHQGNMTAPPQDFGHGGNVCDGREPQERDRHGFLERDGSQDQHAQGGDGRDEGELSADTHVAHAINHPRGWGHFST
jgi:hypothetical protein